MRVLVTGGAGFIGSAVVRYLVNEVDAEVLNIDKLTYAGNLESLKPIAGKSNYRFLQADICNSIGLMDALADFQPDYVIHLAAESHVDRSINGSADFIQTNIIGTYTLLESVRSYWYSLNNERKDKFRMLHVSTDEVYGSLTDEGLFQETTAYDPSSPYSASKAASDHLVTAWHRTYGMPLIISNCSNNYGPYHFPEKLIPLVILNALEGKQIPVYGTGANIRDWLYVDDHARALWLVVQQGKVGRKYNIGGRNELKNIDVVDKICAILDELRPKASSYSDLITYVADRPGHDARYAIDASRLETELGWKATETFDTGILKTIEWYLSNEWWWRPLRDKVYSGERIGILDSKHSV